MKSRADLPHCLAPFHSLRLLGNSQATPCCLISEKTKIPSASDSQFPWFHSEKFKKVRQALLSGQFPAACQKCEDREKAVGKSMRTLYFEILEPRAGTYSEMGDLQDVQHLDLNFSFLCNLKCRMCSGFRSTKWHEDEVKLAEKISFRERPNPAIYQVSLDLQFYKNLVEQCPNLKRIDIKGGEPLISPEAWDFLNFLVETKRAPQIEIAFTTNGLVIPSRIEILSHFKAVSVCFSIEAVGKAYQYIRGHQKNIEDLEANILKLDQIGSVNISFNFTFQAYNAFQVIPTLRWLLVLSRKLKHFSIESLRLDQCILTTPEYLQATTLPFELREKAAHQIMSDELYQEHKRILEPLVNYLRNFNLDNQKDLQRFCEFTKALDEIRNENVCDALPEFESLFNELRPISDQHPSRIS